MYTHTPYMYVCVCLYMYVYVCVYLSSDEGECVPGDGAVLEEYPEVVQSTFSVRIIELILRERT